MNPAEIPECVSIFTIIDQYAATISVALRMATLCLVVVGWVVVDRRNNVRETRKECRSVIANCNEAIDCVMEYAKQYHTGNDHDGILASRIKFQIQRVSTYIKSLEGIGICIAKSHLLEFRQAITLNNFDSELTFRKQQIDSLLIEGIEQTGCALSESLDHAFYAIFKP